MAREFNPHPVTQNGKPDLRYRIAREFCGWRDRRYVLRFCDEFIMSSISYDAAATRAIGHNAVRLGAAVIVEQKGN